MPFRKIIIILNAVFKLKSKFFKKILILNMSLLTLCIFINLLPQILMAQFALTNQSDACRRWVESHVFKNEELHSEDTDNKLVYIKFDKFEHLSEATNCTTQIFETSSLLLNADEKMLLESNLNLTNILNLVNFTFPSGEIPMILVRNILGFNQFVNERKSSSPFVLLSNYGFYFNNVNFDFYLNKTRITKEMCAHKNFYEKQINYFWPMTNVFFNYDVFYSAPVCPYVFLNTFIEQMALLEITNSFIFKNRLEFINVDEDMPKPIGLNIRQLDYLEINVLFEALTSNILYPPIFKTITLLQLTGSPYSIQTDLFESFKKFEYIIFNVDNLSSLLHQGLEWMSFLNSDVNVSVVSNVTKLSKYLPRIILIQFNEINDKHFTRSFDYPDEDLCVFEQFPHKQLVVPSVAILKEEIKCSCTLIWLIQNQRLYLNLHQMRLTTMVKHKLEKDFELYFRRKKKL